MADGPRPLRPQALAARLLGLTGGGRPCYSARLEVAPSCGAASGPRVGRASWTGNGLRLAVGRACRVRVVLSSGRTGNRAATPGMRITSPPAVEERDSRSAPSPSEPFPSSLHLASPSRAPSSRWPSRWGSPRGQVRESAGRRPFGVFHARGSEIFVPPHCPHGGSWPVDSGRLRGAAERATPAKVAQARKGMNSRKKAAQTVSSGSPHPRAHQASADNGGELSSGVRVTPLFPFLRRGASHQMTPQGEPK